MKSVRTENGVMFDVDHFVVCIENCDFYIWAWSKTSPFSGVASWNTRLGVICKIWRHVWWLPASSSVGCTVWGMGSPRIMVSSEKPAGYEFSKRWRFNGQISVRFAWNRMCTKCNRLISKRERNDLNPTLRPARDEKFRAKGLKMLKSIGIVWIEIRRVMKRISDL